MSRCMSRIWCRSGAPKALLRPTYRGWAWFAPCLAPTEVARGTHLLTNHLQRPWLDRDSLLYQSETEKVTPATLHQPGQAEDAATQPVAQAMAAGDCLIFDDRILHRGLANFSEQERWVAYFSYLRPRPGLEEIADTHFEATRSLFGSKSR